MEIDRNVNVKTRASFSHKGFICDCFWLYLAFLDGSTRFNSIRMRSIEFSIFVDTRHIIKKRKKKESLLKELNCKRFDQKTFAQT